MEPSEATQSLSPTVNKKIDYWGRMHAVLALESFAECKGEYAPNATMQAAVEAALLRHYQFMAVQVAASEPPLENDVWGSARYSEVRAGLQWLIDAGALGQFPLDLLHLVRSKGEKSLGWEQWFQSGDPFADKTTDTVRCWGNKTDPTGREFQLHHGVTIMEAIKAGPFMVSRQRPGVRIGGGVIPGSCAPLDRQVRPLSRRYIYRTGLPQRGGGGPRAHDRCRDMQRGREHVQHQNSV